MSSEQRKEEEGGRKKKKPSKLSVAGLGKDVIGRRQYMLLLIGRVRHLVVESVHYNFMIFNSIFVIGNDI